MPDGRYILEIFSGCGRLSGSRLDAGLRVCCPIDSLLGPEFDLTDPVTVREIMWLISSGKVWAVWLATPCTNRSPAKPKGGDGPATEYLARLTARIIRHCHRCGVFFALENLRGGRLWRFGPIAAALRFARAVRVQTCY